MADCLRQSPPTVCGALLEEPPKLPDRRPIPVARDVPDLDPGVLGCCKLPLIMGCAFPVSDETDAT